MIKPNICCCRDSHSQAVCSSGIRTPDSTAWKAPLILTDFRMRYWRRRASGGVAGKGTAGPVNCITPHLYPTYK